VISKSFGACFPDAYFAYPSRAAYAPAGQQVNRRPFSKAKPGCIRSFGKAIGSSSKAQTSFNEGCGGYTLHASKYLFQLGSDFNRSKNDDIAF
jgi:hypothetical protein